jgi:hypothetical protein
MVLDPTVLEIREDVEGAQTVSVPGSVTQTLTSLPHSEHYQWNMDIWGVDSIEAEGELLASLTSALISMGLTASDVVVRVRASRLAVSAPDSALVPLSLDRSTPGS